MKLTESEKKLLTLIGKNPSLPVQELQHELKYKNASTVSRKTRSLREAGYIKGPYYHINLNDVGMNSMHNIFAEIRFDPNKIDEVFRLIEVINCWEWIFPTIQGDTYFVLGRASHYLSASRLLSIIKKSGLIEYNFYASRSRWFVYNPDFSGSIFPQVDNLFEDVTIEMAYPERTHSIRWDPIDLRMMQYLEMQTCSISEIQKMEKREYGRFWRRSKIKYSIEKIMNAGIAERKHYNISPYPRGECYTFLLLIKGGKEDVMKFCVNFGKGCRIHKVFSMFSDIGFVWCWTSPQVGPMLMNMLDNLHPRIHVRCFQLKTADSRYALKRSFNIEHFDFEIQSWIFPYGDVMSELLATLSGKDEVSNHLAVAKDLEYKARSLVSNQDYSEARSILEQIFELNPGYRQSLQNEFGFLFDFTLSAEEDEKRWDENRELVEWRKNLWWILSDENNIDLTEMQSQGADEVKVFEEESTGEEPIEIIDSELKPQEKGATLEKAVLKLFRRFFIIGEEQEEVILKKLRKQGGGLQFGFDVGFECTVKESENVRCHIECKNLEDKIKLSHIAEKIIQTEDDYSGIDHWILISPRSDPVGDLEKKVTKWNNKKKYPFKIQIWSPETRVDEFFGLDPDIYDQFGFHKLRKGETHPSQWSEDKRRRVFEFWIEKLKPVIRLPREWEKYMREPFRMCIDDKEHDEFQTLYQHYVPMRCMDERKNVLSLSLEDHVHEWLKDTRTPIILLLGGFGDGKTAFTYILSRNLAKEFLENPSKGWIPVRFALKDYYSAENSRKFLRERLREFGADIDSWKELKGKHKLNRLVILDGFDEMTKELDPETITKNINSLAKCCDEFKGSKILITSRTYFFENQRNKERLLQKLRPYYLFYLAPIDRQTNIRHLEKHATTPEEKRKLRNMCKLHDPIGLASKPLFLHMVKETLSELPEEDLDEITLYNTYIKKSLYRKIENLEYDRAILTPDEIYSNIVGMMEEIALRIQELGENYFSLEEYQNTSKQTFAEILWKISNPEKDAAERVRIRTLLKQVKTKKDTPKQALDFCHRSMREYFVAKRLCRLLRENREKAKEFLTEFLLNNEILHFAAKLMGRNSSQEYKCNLLYLIRTTRGSNQSRYLGGNAATLLYRLKGELPGNDWSGLNLDYADLSRADLSNKNFRYTSLRFARLDNVNFEGADFRNCDLSGVRIEETAPVLAVTVPPIGDRIIAAYGDNTIRDWNIAQQSNYETQIICENTDGSINQLETHFGSDLCAITNEEVIFYDFGDQKELLQRARFRKKSKYGHVVAKKDILLLVSDEDNQMSKVLAIDLQQRKIICVLDLKKITLCENLDRQTLALPEGKTFLNIKRTETSNTETTISLPAHEVTSLCVRYCDESDKYLLACGQRNGEVLVWQIDLSTDEWQHELVLENRVHEGLVSSLAFLDDSTIASGGVDRKISILRFGPGWGGIEGIEESDLQLIARCKGMKIDGIKRDIEQEMLRKLVLKVEEIAYHGNE